MVNRILLLLYILYSIEVGIFLIVFPWMRLWEDNVFLNYYPQLRVVVMNHFFRGAVTGLGFANLIVGAWEIVNIPRSFRKA